MQTTIAQFLPFAVCRLPFAVCLNVVLNLSNAYDQFSVGAHRPHYISVWITVKEK